MLPIQRALQMSRVMSVVGVGTCTPARSTHVYAYAEAHRCAHRCTQLYTVTCNPAPICHLKFTVVKPAYSSYCCKYKVLIKLCKYLAELAFIGRISMYDSLQFKFNHKAINLSLRFTIYRVSHKDLPTFYNLSQRLEGFSKITKFSHSALYPSCARVSIVSFDYKHYFKQYGPQSKT